MPLCARFIAAHHPMINSVLHPLRSEDQFGRFEHRQGLGLCIPYLYSCLYIQVLPIFRRSEDIWIQLERGWRYRLDDELQRVSNLYGFFLVQEAKR